MLIKSTICCCFFIFFILSAKAQNEITIVEPIPGTKLLSGETVNIVWTMEQPNPVDIYYSYGGNQYLIASNIIAPPYQWLVPYLNTDNLDLLVKSYEQEMPFLIWHQPNAHVDEVASIAFSDDGNRLITTGKDNKVKIWDIPTRSLTEEFLIEDGVLKQAVFFLSDGFVAVTDSVLILYDLLNDIREEVYARDYGTTFRNVSYSDFNALIAVGTENGKVYTFYPNGELVEIYQTGTSSIIYSVKFGYDGSKLLFTDYEGYTHIVDIASGTIDSKGTHGNVNTNTVVWSADTDSSYSRIVSCGVDRTVRLWDYEQNNYLALFNSHTQHIRAVRMSIDGSRAISGSLDAYLRQYDVRNMTEMNQITLNHGGAILSLDITPNLDTIASAGRDNSFKVWSNDEVYMLERSENYDLENDLYIQVPDKSVPAGRIFELSVFSNISKALTQSGATNFDFNLTVEIPILIMEPEVGITSQLGQRYDTITFRGDFNLGDEQIFDFNSLALYSYIDRDSVRILDFEIVGLEIPSIRYINGLIVIIYDCEGEYVRRVYVGNERNGISLSPNPTKESAKLSVDLIETAKYEIQLVDLNGNERHVIYNGDLNHGFYEFNLNLTDIENGTYFAIVKWNHNEMNYKFQVSK
jgi:WD40 repeat protein